MSEQQNPTLEKVMKIIAEQAGVPVEQLTPDTQMIADLSFDSLDVMETVMEVEDEFGVQVEDADTEKLKSIRDVTEYIAKQLATMPKQ